MKPAQACSPRLAGGSPSSHKAILDAATKRADKLRANGKDVDLDALLKLEPDAGTTTLS